MDAIPADSVPGPNESWYTTAGEYLVWCQSSQPGCLVPLCGWSAALKGTTSPAFATGALWLAIGGGDQYLWHTGSVVPVVGRACGLGVNLAALRADCLSGTELF